MSNTYLFTSESVSEGHPDKVADQISDAILDAYLAIDPNSKVACEVLVTTNTIIISGEIKSMAQINLKEIAKNVITKIGYTKKEYQFSADTCEIKTYIDEQSPDINQGVVSEKGLHKEEGAGDQGIMFGYATNESKSFMPISLNLSHIFLEELSKIRKEENLMPYLRPDSKSQVTIEYFENNTPKKIHTIVISTQHDEFGEDETMLTKIKNDIIEILIPRVKKRLSLKEQELFCKDTIIHVNPTGRFVQGGPYGDTGLTGRKIIVDTYGGKGAHGGGAFSGKDPSKVDRSAAYACRHIAKNLVAAGVSNEILVQVSYAIGVAKPMNIYVNTFGTKNVNLSDAEISEKIDSIFDLRPAEIINRLKLKNPIYFKTAAYGHMGRESKNDIFILKEREVYKKDGNPNCGCNQEPCITFKHGSSFQKNIETFPWEKLDYIDIIKKEFKL
tara:strand:- start:392 stop:1723 length:1332 start_codon:yes stop_codon:yes gene_type:complete